MVCRVLHGHLGIHSHCVVYWSAAAASIAVLTSRWLRRLGQPIPSRGERWTKAIWAALLLIQAPLFVAGDHPVWDQWWAEWLMITAFPIYAAFPLALTAWALKRIARARHASPAAA